MAWYHPDQFEEKKPFLEKRATMIKAVRSFFDGQGFLEVETPALQVMPSADMHIHGFETQLWGVDLNPGETMYLHTSPEFEMKKLLVAGVPKLYQICKVFRNGEEGRMHSPEFTMIEWYRAEAGYEDIMEDCVGLLRTCAEALKIRAYTYQGIQCDPFADWQKISVAEAFEQYADIRLPDFLDNTDDFRSETASKNIRVAKDDSWEDLFHAVMAEKIEPHLGQGVPTILYDYPSSMASLSRPKPSDPRFTERFELYVSTVELANAFGELTDAKLQRKRFEEEMKAKETFYGFSYPPDEEFLAALEYGMPESGGIALGIDRLAMLATGTENIKDVLWCT